MNYVSLTIFIVPFLGAIINAAPAPEPFKVLLFEGDNDNKAYQVARSPQMPISFDESDDQLFVEHRQADNIANINHDFNDEDENDDDNRQLVVEAKANNMASVRLFLQRFMRLKNQLFGNKQQRFVIQIFPNGTSSVTTVPATSVVVPPAAAVPLTSPGGPVTPSGVFQRARPGRIANNQYNDDENLVAAVVSEQRKESNMDQDIIVRIPAEYKYLFSNGQQIVLNTQSVSNNKKRIDTSGINNNRKRVNKNRKRFNKKNNNNKMKNFNFPRTHVITL